MTPRACVTCGEYHPIDHDGVTVYYDCLGDIKPAVFLEALLAKGCSPKRAKESDEMRINELAKEEQALEQARQWYAHINNPRPRLVYSKGKKVNNT